MEGEKHAPGLRHRDVSRRELEIGNDLAAVRSAWAGAVKAAAAALLPVTRGAAPAGALAVLLGTGLAVYTVATAVFARSTIGPMWVSLRGSKA